MKLLGKSIGFMLVMNLLQPAPIMAARNKPEGHTLGHYIVHTVVQSAGMTIIGGASTLGTMAGLGITAAAREPLTAMAGVATIAGSILGGIYSVYRLPQWTDSGFLGYETKRNSTQNMVCFLTKPFLIPGIWAGEFIAHLDGVAPEAQ
jgi:hypothetical protein